MARFLSLIALLTWTAAPSVAQSDLSTSSAAIGASGSYSGAVARSSGYGLDGLRAPRVSLDATYGRVSGGVGLSFYEYETAVDGSLGVHIARDRARQLTTTLVMSAQGNEDGGSLLAF